MKRKAPEPIDPASLLEIVNYFAERYGKRVRVTEAQQALRLRREKVVELCNIHNNADQLDAAIWDDVDADYLYEENMDGFSFGPFTRTFVLGLFLSTCVVGDGVPVDLALPSILCNPFRLEYHPLLEGGLPSLSEPSNGTATRCSSF
jgi:hypothetical protein